VNWIFALFLCLLSVSQIASAEIYKCVGPEGLAYRDTPCPPDQREQAVIASPQKANWQTDSVPRTDYSNIRADLPLSGTRLTLGMTDTSGWREEWLYKRASNMPRVLYFENGRLAAHEDAPPPAMEARASTAYIQQ